MTNTPWQYFDGIFDKIATQQWLLKMERVNAMNTYFQLHKATQEPTKLSVIKQVTLCDSQSVSRTFRKRFYYHWDLGGETYLAEQAVQSVKLVQTGQRLLLHSIVSRASPLQPAALSRGRTHSRVLTARPPPQDWEHGLHSLHWGRESSQFPLICAENNCFRWKVTWLLGSPVLLALIGNKNSKYFLFDWNLQSEGN